MVTEQQCKELVNLGIANDAIDFIGDFIPLLDLVTNKLTDQMQIQLETKHLSHDEFLELKEMYFLPDGIRGLAFCFMKGALKSPIPIPQSRSKRR